MPRVSCIVTCFNLGQFLEELLASLRAQTFQDFDIVIVDDGSTDEETRRVLARVGARLRVVRTENRGLSAARNLGASLTSGEYVCALDADDVLMPELLERSVARLDADPSLSFVSHWLETFGDESWEWKPERCDFPALLEMNTVNGAALVRRSALESVGGWDETMRDGCEDWDLWITMVERGHRGEIIPEVLFRYRRRGDSMSRVKFAGGGFTKVYARLVRKHAEAYRAHLKDLVVRREADLAWTRAQSEEMAGRLELEALPALQRARDDLAAAARRRARWDAAESAGHALEELRRRLAGTEAELLRLDALRHRAEEESQALRASLSWRLTRPLRAAGSLLQRLARPAP